MFMLSLFIFFFAISFSDIFCLLTVKTQKSQILVVRSFETIIVFFTFNNYFYNIQYIRTAILCLFRASSYFRLSIYIECLEYFKIVGTDIQIRAELYMSA